MSECEDMIREIRKLYRTKLGRKKGVIMDESESQEVGIWMYHYEVLGRSGLYYGHWTEAKPKLADRTIVSRIVDTEDCEQWESLDEERLCDCLDFLSSI